MGWTAALLLGPLACGAVARDDDMVSSTSVTNTDTTCDEFIPPAG